MWRFVTLVGLALLTLSGCSKAPVVPREELSVVLVTLDTTRADRIGAFGGHAVPTPNLDAMAREGTRFLRASSQVPLTLPSHATILTGRYPASHGVRHNGIYRLRDAETTLAEHLKGHGFETAAFVGAFVLNRGFGTDQGFDTYDDVSNDHLGRRNQFLESQRSADEVNARVFDWIEHRKPGRFFLWVHYYDPHVPYAPPEKTGRTLEGTGYDREISYVDACFGDLIRKLRETGVLDRSVLWVAGDHGEGLGEHRESTHGVFLYESALHVPMLVRAPGVVPKDRSVATPVGLVDIAPTILDLLRLPPLEHAQGGSLVGEIEGAQKGSSGIAFAETFMPRIEFGWSELRMVRDARYKYVEAPRPELYDLVKDPGETTNLVAEEKDRVAEMSALLEEWKVRTSDPSAERESERAMSPEEEARLRSLGYLRGSPVAAPGAGTHPDPKDGIDEAIAVDAAREMLASGNAAEALARLDQIVRRSPRNHLARSTRVQALIRMKRLADAEEEASAAIAAAQADPMISAHLLEQARRVLASVYWLRGKAGDAKREYALAVAMSKANPGGSVFPGLLLGAAGGKEEAERLVADALERNPRDGAALAARFELQSASGDDAGALETAKRLADARAGDPPSLAKAGKLLRERGYPRLAAECFRAAQAQVDPDADLQGYLGTALLAAHDLDGAEKALTTASRLRPQDPRPYLYLGNIALLRGDEGLARRRFHEASERDPKWSAPDVNLALWLAEKGRRGEAESVLEAALEKNPGDAEARAALGRVRGASR